MTQNKIDNGRLRSFGLIVAGGFALVAVAPAIFRGHSPRLWALAVSGILAGMGLIVPFALAPVYRAWMAVGEVLGWVNTRIILLLVYYAVIVPIGVILHLAGKDPLRLRFHREAESYRIPRVKRPASHMQRQY